MCPVEKISSEAVQQSQVSSSNPTVSDILGPLLLQASVWYYITLEFVIHINALLIPCSYIMLRLFKIS